jgi:hypothetical protein
MARKGHIAYLSGLRYQPFPRTTLGVDSLFAFVSRRQVDYLFFGIMEFRLEPALQFLSVQDSMPGLREVYRSRESRVFAIDSLVVRRGVPAEVRERSLLGNLAVAERNGDPIYIVFALTVLGRHYVAAGQLAPAESTLRRALEVASKARDPNHEPRTVTARYNLALVLQASGRTSEAIGLLEANLAYLSRTGGSGLSETQMLLTRWRGESAPSP